MFDESLMLVLMKYLFGKFLRLDLDMGEISFLLVLELLFGDFIILEFSIVGVFYYCFIFFEFCVLVGICFF